MRLRWRYIPLAIVALAMALEATALALGRRPTHASQAPGRHLLIYDDDCRFCSLAATLVRHRTSSIELVGFSQLPREGVLESLDRASVVASAHYVTPEGVEYHGGESVTRVLRLLPGGEVVRLLDWPVLRGFREVGYRLAAWQRPRVSRLLGFG